MKLSNVKNTVFFLSIVLFISSFVEFLDPLGRNGKTMMKPVDTDDSSSHPNIAKKVYLDDN